MLLDSMNNAGYFSSLHLYSGYWNVIIEEPDRPKTAFVVPGKLAGIYMFKRMPFGLVNAPATFCRIIDKIFYDIKLKYLLSYIDDFTVFSRDFENHLVYLKEVLQRLQQAGLKLKPSKCSFVTNKITFLGHEVSTEGISPNREKVKAIEDIPAPTTLKAVRSFYSKLRRNSRATDPVN